MSFRSGISRAALERGGVEVRPGDLGSGSGKAGEKAELALCRSLTVLGIEHVAQYRWGVTLQEPRQFVSDAAIPHRHLLLEIDGRAHIAGYERFCADMERQRIGVHAGFTFLRYSPAEARDGTASLDIQRYLRRHP